MPLDTKAPEYAFTYTDTGTLSKELNDFFSYDRAEMDLVLASKEEFNTQWGEFHQGPKKTRKRSRHREAPEVKRWRDTDVERREKFVARLIDSLESTYQDERVKALEVLSYIAQGRSVRVHWRWASII